MNLRDVFVVGGEPSHTYVPRNERALEESLRQAVDDGYELIVISGGTKSGKTVLARKVLDSGLVPLSGGEIESVAEFWSQAAGHLGVPLSVSTSMGKSASAEVGGSVGVGTTALSAKGVSASSLGVITSQSVNVAGQVASGAKDGSRTILVDDFHYIPAKVQTQLVRAVKNHIFGGLSVAVLVVPHRQDDPVAVEKEMNGRVRTIRVPPWTTDELELIATKGQDALNVQFADGLVKRFGLEALGSPHLMQRFCRAYCRSNKVETSSDGLVYLPALENEEMFFTTIARSLSKDTYETLLRGPQARKSRKERHLKSGGATDTYGAILRALAHAQVTTQITYNELRTVLRVLLNDDSVPQKHEVTNALNNLTRIAKDDIDGEPVLEFLPREETLHIADPYFAFFLRWAAPKGRADA